MTWEARLDQWREELDLLDRLEGWVSLADAVTRTGVSRSTLRNWYRKGRIRSRLTDGPYGPQRLVQLGEVEALVGRSTRLGRSATQPTELLDQLELMRSRIDLLERRLAALEGTENDVGPDQG